MSTISLPSVQALYLEMLFNDTCLATGTGFIVRVAARDFLVTCRHNLTGRNQDTGAPISKSGGVPNRVRVFRNFHFDPASWSPCIEDLYTEDGTCRWHEHPVLGSSADFVALELRPGPNFTAYPIDPSAPGAPIYVGPSDAVSVVGFPFGATAGGYLGIWASGSLACEPQYDQGGLPRILIDCRTRQGQSGSPVYAFRSGGVVQTTHGQPALFRTAAVRFLGIYSGRINKESDIGYVWKAAALQELVAVL